MALEINSKILIAICGIIISILLLIPSIPGAFFGLSSAITLCTSRILNFKARGGRATTLGKSATPVHVFGVNTDFKCSANIFYFSVSLLAQSAVDVRRGGLKATGVLSFLAARHKE